MHPNAKSSITEHVLRSVFKTEVFGRDHIEIHERIDSTNERAKELALAGAREGTLVLAESQTAGRGRLGRTWHSPPGLNIYLSLVLRPELPPARISLLTLAAGMAGASAIGRIIGQTPSVKWPNDLLLQNRKIAGILAEMNMKNAKVLFVILGVGINVNLSAHDLPPELAAQAGSLFMATGRTWDRVEVLAAFLYEMEKYYEFLTQNRYEELLNQYRQICQTLNSQVRFVQQSNLVEGTAIDVNQSGELIVERAIDGEIVHVNAGDVSLLSIAPKHLADDC